nr:MAG TPA: hypothetical protein [Caudoviricetes sp.]
MIFFRKKSIKSRSFYSVEKNRAQRYDKDRR